MVTCISIGMLITFLLVFGFDFPTSYSNNNDVNWSGGKHPHSYEVKRRKRTVGGSEAPTGAFPYQIALRTKDDEVHFCSGSILRPMIVLTAAHCIDSKETTNLIVVAGSNKLSSGGTRHNVIEKVTHEDFDQHLLKNDIALLIVYPPFFYSNTIKPIELDTSHIGHGIHVTLSGWGMTGSTGSNPDKLQFLNLTTIANSECRSKVLSYKDCVTESTICTLTKKGEGTCKADSGGPLVADGRQVGIVSWGEPCARGYPDIYTRVSTFIPWIRKEVERYTPLRYKC